MKWRLLVDILLIGVWVYSLLTLGLQNHISGISSSFSTISMNMTSGQLFIASSFGLVLFYVVRLLERELGSTQGD